ncbi:unnamed protein product [Pleuronectes platessa]|uniref:Uncharacterized protein n=1 Tax=Pleuronectes platessa TaxID=8262 RepID=A0A9N7V124_PLEPL|nr:unnamed protein product [Pleuronectes platessa]
MDDASSETSTDTLCIFGLPVHIRLHVGEKMQSLVPFRAKWTAEPMTPVVTLQRFVTLGLGRDAVSRDVPIFSCPLRPPTHLARDHCPPQTRLLQPGPVSAVVLVPSENSRGEKPLLKNLHQGPQLPRGDAALLLLLAPESASSSCHGVQRSRGKLRKCRANEP